MLMHCSWASRFTANFVIGWYNIMRYYPGIFRALSPHYLFQYLVDNGKAGWEQLAGVLLAFTGALQPAIPMSPGNTLRWAR